MHSSTELNTDLRVDYSLHRMLDASFVFQHRVRDRPRSLISHRCIYPFLVNPFVNLLLHTPLTTSREISRLVLRYLILRVIYLPELGDPFATGVLMRDRSFESLDLGGLTSDFAVSALTTLRRFLLLPFPIALPTGRAAVVLPFAAGPQATTLLALAGREVLLLVLYSAILEPDLHLLLR